VTAALRYHHGNLMRLRLLDGTLKRAVAANLAQVPAAVHEGSRVGLILQSDRSARNNSAFLHIRNVLADSNDSVRVVAHQVRLNQVLGNQSGLVSRGSGGHENTLGKSLQAARINSQCLRHNLTTPYPESRASVEQVRIIDYSNL
jgi:hypothetical protein